MSKPTHGWLIAFAAYLAFMLNPPSWAQTMAVGGFFLVLDGADCGLIGGFTGGEPALLQADQPSSLNDAGFDRNLKYTDITIYFESGLSRRFYQWIQDYLATKDLPHSGSIVAFNMLRREVNRLTFTGASITELVIPVIRKEARSIPMLAMTIQPRTVQRSFTPAGIPFPESSSPLMSNPPPDAIKMIPRSLQIAGLEHDCISYESVEVLPVKRVPVNTGSGTGTRGFESPKILIEFANLPTTELFAWEEDYIVRGNRGDAKKRDGTFTCARDAQSPQSLFALSFTKLAITRLTQRGGTGSQVLLWRAEMEGVLQINFDGMVSPYDTRSGGTSPSQPANVRTATGSESTPAAPAKPARTTKPVQLVVAPDITAMELRDSVQFKATATYPDKTTQEVTKEADWSSGDYTVIEVFEDGLATAKKTGKAEIFAEYQDLEAQTREITVLDPSEAAEGRVVQILITPQTTTVKLKDTCQFKSIALYSDKTTRDITSKVEWSAGDYTVLEFSENGLATALKAGTTTVFATYKEIEGESGTITVSSR